MRESPVLDSKEDFLTGLYFIHNFFYHSCVWRAWPWILAGLLGWRASLEWRKWVFSISQVETEAPLPSFHSSAVWVKLEVAPPPWAGRGLEAAMGSGSVPEVSCSWLQVSQRKLWRAGETNPLHSLQDDEDASAWPVDRKLGRFLFEEYALRTMLLMILSQVQVC